MLWERSHVAICPDTAGFFVNLQLVQSETDGCCFLRVFWFDSFSFGALLGTAKYLVER